MRVGKNIRQRKDGRWEARYIKGRDEKDKIIYGYAYGKTYEEAEQKREWSLERLSSMVVPKAMNLMILGAGTHGQEVYEIASNMRCFHNIAFLDDWDKGYVLGRWEEYEKFLNEYPIALPAIGDGELRKRWILKLANAGFVIPTLIDPSAIISRNCSIGYGTVICSKSVLNNGSKIGCGCIVSSGAIIARETFMRDYTFINSGQTLLRSGEVIL